MPRQNGYSPTTGRLAGKMVVITEILPGRMVKVDAEMGLRGKDDTDIVSFDDLKLYASWGFIPEIHKGLSNEQVRAKIRRRKVKARV